MAFRTTALSAALALTALTPPALAQPIGNTLSRAQLPPSRAAQANNTGNGYVVRGTIIVNGKKYPYAVRSVSQGVNRQGHNGYNPATKCCTHHGSGAR